MSANVNPLRPVVRSTPLLIQVQRRGADAVTIRVSGELDLASAPKVDVAIRDCEETEIGQILVDLSNLEFLDSTGLSVLLRAKERIGSRLRVIPSEHGNVTRVLALTGTEDMLAC